MKKYAFFDVDQTIYNGYLTSSFTNYLGKEKLIDKKFLELNIQLQDEYEKGLLSYNDSVVKIISLQAEALKGKRKNDISKITDHFLIENNRFFPYAKELFKMLYKSNFQSYLISGAASPLIEAVGRLFNIDKYFASELELIENFYTGKVIKFLNAENKHNTIKNIIGEEIKKHFSLAFGDSLGDIEMLSIVNHAFVINPHQKEMIEISKNNKWFLVTSKNIISYVKLML